MEQLEGEYGAATMTKLTSRFNGLVYNSGQVLIEVVVISTFLVVGLSFGFLTMLKQVKTTSLQLKESHKFEGVIE